MKQPEEILTYDLFIKNDILYFQLPVYGLIDPKFLLKNNNLYIFLYNYTECFLIKNINNNFMKYIIDKKAYIIEGISTNELTQHLINLSPLKT